MGELPKFTQEEFLIRFKYLVEEEMRRRQRNEDAWNVFYIKKAVKQLTGVDPKEVIAALDGVNLELKKEEKSLSKLSVKVDLMMIADKATHYKKVFQDAQEQAKLNALKPKAARIEENKKDKEKNEEVKEEKNLRFKFNLSQVEFEELKEKGFFSHIKMPTTFAEMENFQKELGQETFSRFRGIMKSFRGWLISRGFNFDTFKDIESIGIKTPFQLLALAIQNKVQHKNVDRLDAFKSNDYCDVFEPANAEKYIGMLVGQTLKDERIRMEHNKPKDPNYSSDDIAFFAFTEDLEAAAGMLVKNFDLGTFERVQNLFRTQPADCKLVYEKLQMIRDREFKGKKFEIDFKMRKKWIRALYTKYKEQYKHDEWKNLWWKDHSGKNYQGKNSGYVQKGKKGVRGKGRGGRRP